MEGGSSMTVVDLPFSLSSSSTPASPPHSLITLPDVSRFSENQAYDVFVDLTLPVTRSNVNLGQRHLPHSLRSFTCDRADLPSLSLPSFLPGNFMVHLSLLPAFPSIIPSSSKASKQVASSSSVLPAPIHSSTLPTLLAALPPLSPFYLLSLVFHTPKKTITLKMLDGVVLVPSGRNKAAESVKMVRVWVGREDLWKSLGDGKNGGSGKEVVTLGGKVRIVGKLSGIRFVYLLGLSSLSRRKLELTLFVRSRRCSFPTEPSSPTTPSSLFSPSPPPPFSRRSSSPS